MASVFFFCSQNVIFHIRCLETLAILEKAYLYSFCLHEDFLLSYSTFFLYAQMPFLFNCTITSSRAE